MTVLAPPSEALLAELAHLAACADPNCSRRYGELLGPAEHGGDRRSKQVTSSDLKPADKMQRERARAVAAVPAFTPRPGWTSARVTIRCRWCPDFAARVAVCGDVAAPFVEHQRSAEHRARCGGGR